MAASLLLVAGIGARPAEAAQHQNANLYAYWRFSGGPGYWNVDQELKVQRKAAASYWAQYWTWAGSSDGGYLGVQTDGSRFDGSVGETAIFSLWNATAASGPSCKPFGGEGTGMSCRLAFPIRTDRYYRLRVWRLHSDGGGQWWGAWILDETTRIDHYVGSIRVAANHTLIAPTMNFSEYFGTAVGCNQVPVSVVYWTQPAANSLGGGRYQYGSTFDHGSRGACTGGSVTPWNFSTTRGVRIIQGGGL